MTMRSPSSWNGGDVDAEFSDVWLEKLAALKNSGVDPYPSGLRVVDRAVDLHARYAEAATPEPDRATIGGRLMFRNRMGKAAFLRIQDGTGRIQVWAKVDRVGPEAFAQIDALDVGDIVWATGTMMRTRTGELTISADHVVLAAKTLHPFPDRWNSVTDIETRSRARHVDLFMNEDAREAFRRRSRIVSGLRRFLEARDFLEVETPMMHPVAGGAAARPFTTHHNALDLPLTLRIAPELYLKRLVVGGFERVFELNRNFRNEGVDGRHNPEFTMLEFYQAWSTWEDLVALTETMLEALAVDVCGSAALPFGDHVIDWTGPYRRVSMEEAVAEATGLSGADLRSVDALAGWWAAGGHSMKDAPRTVGKWWEQIFGEVVEPTLIQPTFVTHFPIEISPLARRSPDPDIAERFELYVAGFELANGFSELADAVDQAGRFRAQVAERKAGDATAMMYDTDYVRALGHGMPPTAGMGLGVDRLAMLFTNRSSIRDVILFPLMRPSAG